MFERALSRLTGAPGSGSPIVVTGRAQVPLVQRAVDRSGVEIWLMIVEPEGRNTAPAALAAALASSDTDILVILPSDHLIRDEPGFAKVVADAADVAHAGHIVTFGIAPGAPETGYGYIEIGDEIEGAHRVRRFKEKPDRSEAERLAGDGRHLWNSGIFVVSSRVLIEEAGTHCPELLEGVKASMAEPQDGTVELGPGFSGLEKISIDHAIMERTSLAAVIPIDVGWDDVGSFDALWDISDKDEDGNSIVGDVTTLGVRRSLIRSTSRRVAVAGLDDVVVVETPEAVLVVPRAHSQQVRELLEGRGTD